MATTANMTLEDLKKIRRIRRLPCMTLVMSHSRYTMATR